MNITALMEQGDFPENMNHMVPLHRAQRENIDASNPASRERPILCGYGFEISLA
jgi:hypothetical protein